MRTLYMHVTSLRGSVVIFQTQNGSACNEKNVWEILRWEVAIFGMVSTCGKVRMKPEYLKVASYHMSSITDWKTSEDTNFCVHQWSPVYWQDRAPVEAMFACHNTVRFSFRCVPILETVGKKTINFSCCCSVNCCVESGWYRCMKSVHWLCLLLRIDRLMSRSFTSVFYDSSNLKGI